LYNQSGGSHVWSNAVSGTAGNAITFVDAMTLDASGNLGIGTTSPSFRLHAVSSAAIVSRLGSSGGSGAFVNFIDSGASPSVAPSVGAIGNNLVFMGDGSSSERMRIDSSGNLLVGTTTAVSGSNHIVVGSNSIQGIKKDFTNLDTSAQSFGFDAGAGGVYVASMKSISGASVAFLIACTFDNSAINMFTTSLGGCTAGGATGTISAINGDARTYTFSRNGGTGVLQVTASSTATGTTTIYLTPINQFA
jgi:hypothetical protein